MFQIIFVTLGCGRAGSKGGNQQEKERLFDHAAVETKII